jgi:colicin import membrane protein
LKHRFYSYSFLVQAALLHLGLLLCLGLGFSWFEHQPLRAQQQQVISPVIQAVAVASHSFAPEIATELAQKKVEPIEQSERTPVSPEPPKTEKLQKPEKASIPERKPALQGTPKTVPLSQPTPNPVLAQKPKDTQDAFAKQPSQQKEQVLIDKKRAQNLAQLQKKMQQLLDENLAEEQDLLAQADRERGMRLQEMDRYIGLQRQKVSRLWLAQDRFMGHQLMTKLEISLAPDGQVLSVVIVRSSGDEGLDLSARNAILKASPLPVPLDPKVFEAFRRYRFTFRPDELKSEPG